MSGGQGPRMREMATPCDGRDRLCVWCFAVRAFPDSLKWAQPSPPGVCSHLLPGKFQRVWASQEAGEGDSLWHFHGFQKTESLWQGRQPQSGSQSGGRDFEDAGGTWKEERGENCWKEGEPKLSVEIAAFDLIPRSESIRISSLGSRSGLLYDPTS